MKFSFYSVKWYFMVPSCSANIAWWLGHIPHPTMWIVILFVSWICDFQVLDLETRHIIHRDFKNHRDWSNLLPTFWCSWVGKSYLRNHVMFDTSLEFLDRPFCLFLLKFEFIGLSLHSFWQFECYIRCRLWHWEFYDYLCRKVILWELCSHLHCELKLILGHLINKGINAERSRIFPVDSIVHYKKFTIWWVNCHCLHCFEITHIHTLMEVAVIKHHTANMTCRWFSDLEIIVKD